MSGAVPARPAGEWGSKVVREELISGLTERFGATSATTFRNQQRIQIPADRLSDAMVALRHDFAFDMLVDVTCVDYLSAREATDRFGLVYLMTNTDSGERLTVRVMLNDPDPTVASVAPIWEAANWLEREVWDMFGIRFEGHPDLRRILLPEEFVAHPLRKDYPLQGRGERHNFPAIQRNKA